jgi:hypothetical protein
VIAEAFGAWLVTPSSPANELDPVGLLYLLVFGGGFVIAAYLAGPATQHLAADPDQAALLTRRATIGMIVFGAGLFFLGMRLLQLDGLPFAWPIWLVASAIAAALYLVQSWRWWRSDHAIRPA